MKRLGYSKPIKAKHLRKVLDLHLDDLLLKSFLFTSVEQHVARYKK